LLACAVLVCFTRLRRHRPLRVVFLLTLVGYLGFVNGDMVSQAQLVGWAQSGVPWRLAPGLALLTAAAVAVPVFSKKQLYCHHVCPFGAAQQLVKRRLPWQWHPPGRLAQGLQLIPPALLLLVVAAAIWHWPVNLAAIEPFDAFLFQIAGWATLSVAAVGLAASLVVPMAYCRFGCPTGSVLNYFRFSGGSDRLTRRDLVALGLLLLAIVGSWR
jgi:polyferredoxin